MIAALIMVLSAARPACASPGQLMGPSILGAIYGEDDRKDLHELPADAPARKLARSTVALFRAENVKIAGKTAELTGAILKDTRTLAPNQRFAEQPTGAYCSGALVAPDVIATAGHCVTTQAECQGLRFVFDYSIPAAGHDPVKVPAAGVFQCEKLIKSIYKKDASALDWALIRLDRPAEGRTPLALSSDTVKTGMEVFVIGHPLGLPAKVAAGKVHHPLFTLSHDAYFTTNLDINHSNSGSPVFNATTLRMVGILVRTTGEDFAIATAPDGGTPDGSSAQKWNTVVKPGSDVTRVKEIMGELNRALNQPAPAFDGGQKR